ncbi:branched-chain amino acid transaminase [Cesiribacter andamanensis]|uniref:Branched-chain-amino-acid aminotransferase n=1 Tax=Cesiribacter andamanensis AMV16 TaxID=1279009 RepID=M7NJS0_9BACT|nr:branched-chain amino acid transaminase [Cesiribacter andamanensis]EMR02045.1 Branched-chain-amino-acid aminotransferase [Cesiribacter andamanensis AMV16]
MYFSSTTLAYIDGDFIKADGAQSTLYSQSLHYGYAVFEGIRAYNTPQGPRVFKAREHYERLHYSCQAIGLPLHQSVAELTGITYQLLERNGLQDAYIRPLVFAAEPHMGLTTPASSSLFMAAWAWGKYLGDKSLRLLVSPYQRPNPKAVPLEAKVAGHYVNSIIASSHAKAQGYDEALLLDGEGFVAEGPGANFFFEKGGELYTAPAGSILRGITRNTIVELAREAGIRVREEFFTPDALKEATGAFMTGTAVEVVGVASVNEQQFSKPFSETLGGYIAERYQALVRGGDLAEKMPFRKTA